MDILAPKCPYAFKKHSEALQSINLDKKLLSMMQELVRTEVTNVALK